MYIYDQKTVLVTGASTGIGYALAQELAKKGSKLILTATARSEDKLHTLADELKSSGTEAHVFIKDLSKIGAAEELFNEIKSSGLDIDLLINNAGYFNYDNGTDFSFESLNNHMSINFTAPAILTKALANYTTKIQKKKNSHRGFVINILDAKIFGLNPDYYTYTLSKQAMYGLTKMSALSYSSCLRVNGIAPGITLLAPGQDQKAFKKSHKQNLLKASSTVEEITSTIQLIIKSRSMTGHVTLLDGGAHLAPPRKDVGL